MDTQADPENISKLFLSNTDLLQATFTNDPKMPWLSQVYDPSSMKKILSDHFSERLPKISTIEISPLAYVPSMRATFLYRIRYDTDKTVDWIVKTNTNKQPHRVYANYWALWHESKGEISFPAPIGYLLDPPLTFQEKISGTRLGAQVDDPRFLEWVSSLAKALAKFHALSVPLSGHRGLQQELRNFHRWKNLLIQIRPDLEKCISSLGKQIIEKMTQSFCVSHPIHADFHHTNVLAGDHGVHLIDMDEVAYGDPCVDVGRFLSSLRLPSLRFFGSFNALETARHRFMDTYLQQNPYLPEKVHLFEAAALFTSAASTFRMQRKNWKEEIDLFLDEAADTFKKTVKPSRLSKPHTPCSVKTTYPDWVFQEEYVRTLLAPSIYQEFGQEITNCRCCGQQTRGHYQVVCYNLKIFGKEGICRIELFVHPEKEEYFLLTLLATMNQRLHDKRASIYFQKPLVHLPELGAVACYAVEGQRLSDAILHCDPEKIAARLAQDVCLIEQLGGPLYVKRLRLYEMFLHDSQICIDFTAQKTRKATPINLNDFLRHLRYYGIKNQKKQATELFLESFKKQYESLRRS